tara:strand:- start:1284 stop:1529 length:246 start_codon:yes stop_codon:yes gene_type:complete
LLPSDLFHKYNQPGGQWALELDLLVANEIADQLNDSVNTNKNEKRRKGASSAVARRDQKRKLNSPAETAKQLDDIMKNKEG